MNDSIGDANDLHAAIINLQPKPYDGTDTYNAYCRGHKEARHAAAELVYEAASLHVQEHAQEGESEVLEVDLPERVIDQLVYESGFTYVEPEPQHVYDLAQAIKREVLARLPSRVVSGGMRVEQISLTEAQRKTLCVSRDVSIPGAAASVQSHRVEGESEPAGWRWKWGDTDHHKWVVSDIRPYGPVYRVEPLYAVSAPVPADGGRDQREQLKVAVSLLRECIGPLEVSAAVIESDDGEEMEALIGRVRKFVKDADALAAAPSVSLPVADCGVERDAARYRWLRAQSWHDGPLCVLRDPKMVLTRGSGLGADCPSLDRLDAAIDAALAVPKDSGAPHEEGGVVTGGEVDRG